MPEPDIVCRCDSDHWQVDDFEDDISPEITVSINEAINDQEDSGSLKIPTKYYDFTKTKVSFACEVDGGMLKEVDGTQLYCYLPTKASWGFKFLMNTDMIPTGPRDDIEIDFSEQININAEISEIAGRKFFDWIKALCDLKKYKLNMIFSLIPVFETNIREHGKYKALIERFKNGFDYQVQYKEFIPVNSHDYALIKNIILDETGLMSSDIMKDEDFFTITGYRGLLPIKELRSDREFKAFLKRYLKELDSESNIWNFEDLKKLCSNLDFREWVNKQENNNRFLEFLLKKEILKDFLDEEIFIEESSGELYCASNLYYDIDEHLVDLQSFKSLLPHLSLATRKYFKENEKWDEKVENQFHDFDPNSFINNVLLSNSENDSTAKILESKMPSLHFFRFLAINNIGVNDKISALPFINDEGQSVDGFDRLILFFSSEDGRAVAKYEWMDGIPIEFVSQDYEECVKDYFCTYLNVREFSDDVIVKDIILSEDYHSNISNAINETFDTSKHFMCYCYDHRNLFEDGDLRKYSLHVYDSKGEDQWRLTENYIYFQSDLYDSYSSKEWLDSNWMCVLDENYLYGAINKAEYIKFLSSKYGVNELTEKIFYTDVVKRNLKDIAKNTSGQADSDGLKNIDFIKYLDANYHLIFEEEKDRDIFSDFVPVSTTISDLSLEDSVYVYDEELSEIMKNSWLPKDIICLCNKEYGKSHALLAIGCKTYRFGEFYDDVIVGELDSINDNIDCKETSISFHSFIIKHLGSLTIDQQNKMVGAKVFLYGNDNTSATSSGHKTLSAKARELFDKGLVKFSDIDIIDPDYKTEDNSEYWETRLGNSKFTVSHFFSWLKDNSETFRSTLQDKKLNIEFWRWLKVNANDKSIEDIPVLPIFLKNSSVSDGSKTVYFSDEYMGGAGIESSVTFYDGGALFISPIYIGENDSIEDWKTFWIKVGIKYDIVDILVETIIQNLLDIFDENLPKLIAENREALEKRYDDGLVSHLTNLRVKAYDGKFYTINETIYIDCEKDEPFPYIKIPNQISFNSAEERRLIKDIIDEVGADCVSTLSGWQQRKLDCYLTMQTKDSESVRKFHYQFIEDLSIIRNTGKDSLKEIERISEIYLLNKGDEFCKASSLTMGSVYNPFFDFEACGVDLLNYVGNSYSIDCSEYVGKLFRALHIHCDFQKEDINLLTDRQCSLYFWSKYLSKKDDAIDRIKQFISDGLFDELSCIPTKDYMKMPTDLYSGSEVSKYIRAIEDWENKIPLKDLPEIKLTDNDSTLFKELPFKSSLDFLDALYALVTIIGQDRRTQLLAWMIDKYEESYDAKILEYREDEHALWYNNKNENVQIKELYALDYSDRTLEQYFGTNHRIVNKAYFPTGDSFKRACDILGIKTITSDSLKMEPMGESLYTSRNMDLKLFALVIAGIADNEDWLPLYERYCEKLSVLVLHKCESISITYTEDENINQSLRRFYHKENSNDFYFVDSLDGKRVFTLFVNEYMKFLGITDVTDELVEDIMDSIENAVQFAKEQNVLMLDEAFKDEMDKLIPGIKRDLSGKKVEEDDESYVDYRPTFTTSQGDELEDIVEETTGFPDSNSPIGISVMENEEEKNRYGNESKPSSCDYDVSDRLPKEKDSAINKTSEINNLSSVDMSEERGGYVKKQLEDDYVYTPDDSDYMGSIDKNPDYEPLGSTPKKPKTRHHPKPFTKYELNRLRSNGSPLELESLPATREEINILVQMGISPEQIADTNYLAQLRLYMNLTEELNKQPEESMEEFVYNADDVTTHALKDGRYIHTCSAANGVMYISPSVWNKMVDDKWVVCVYLDGRGKNFHYINSAEEFLKLVEKDDVVLKITGKEKVNVVNRLYNGLLTDVKGTAYTLIRVAARTNMDAVYAHYIGSMAEADDGNEDDNEY